MKKVNVFLPLVLLVMLITLTACSVGKGLTKKTSQRQAIPSGFVRLPDVKGMTKEQATKALNDVGVDLIAFIEEKPHTANEIKDQVTGYPKAVYAQKDEKIATDDIRTLQFSVKYDWETEGYFSRRQSTVYVGIWRD